MLLNGKNDLNCKAIEEHYGRMSLTSNPLQPQEHCPEGRSWRIHSTRYSRVFGSFAPRRAGALCFRRVEACLLIYVADVLHVLNEKRRGEQGEMLAKLAFW